MIKKLLGTEIILDWRAFPSGDKISISKDVQIGKYRNLQIDGRGQLRIEQKVLIREFFNVVLYGTASLHIGEAVFFNNCCSVNCLGTIVIGGNTIFGEGVKLYDHNHEYTYQEKVLVVEKHKFTTGHIVIGKNCWIGSNVTILNNVEIGDNTIIGANCLIYKSISANSIVRHKEELIITS